MRVQCITTQIDNPSAALVKSGWWHAEKYLTIGKEYNVYAIYSSYYSSDHFPGEDAYLICDDNYNDNNYYWPIYVPAVFFIITDHDKPSSWMRIPDAPGYLGPPEIGPDYYERLVDGDISSLSAFRKIRNFQSDIILPGEHATLVFENNIMETIYVVGGILNEGIYDYNTKQMSIGLPKEACEIAPNSINYHTAPIHGSGLAYSYEEVFSKMKNAKKCLIYVVPFYSTEDVNKPLFDYKLVCYELTFEDLVSLDFHLYFPPNEKMKNVKMDPPYESFKIIYR